MALPALLTAMQMAGPAMQALGGLKQLGAERRETPIEQQMGQIAGATLSPTHPLYQRLVAEGAGQRQKAFMGNLEDMVRRNRQLAIMGRQQMFDPERRDEQMFRGTLGAAEQSREAARQAALGRLSGAYGQYGGLAPGQRQRQEMAGKKTAAFGGEIGRMGNVAQERGFLNPQSTEYIGNKSGMGQFGALASLFGGGGGGVPAGGGTQAFSTGQTQGPVQQTQQRPPVSFFNPYGARQQPMYGG